LDKKIYTISLVLEAGLASMDDVANAHRELNTFCTSERRPERMEEALSNLRREMRETLSDVRREMREGFSDVRREMQLGISDFGSRLDDIESICYKVDYQDIFIIFIFYIDLELHHAPQRSLWWIVVVAEEQKR
jgi:hypothetical protein